MTFIIIGYLHCCLTNILIKNQILTVYINIVSNEINGIYKLIIDFFKQLFK